MGVPVLVLGASGSGKSSSLRNFKHDDIRIMNVASKPLPFRNKEKLLVANHATYPMIKKVLDSGACKSYVIDDANLLMTFEEFDKINETGYGKFSSMAKNYYDCVKNVIENVPDDTIVYFLQHIDIDENGRTHAKSAGKMIENKLGIESLFTIVLMAETDGKRHWFTTQSDGMTTCKSPMEMFPDVEIDNDLKMVDDTIREYYGLEKPKSAKKDVKE